MTKALFTLYYPFMKTNTLFSPCLSCCWHTILSQFGLSKPTPRKAYHILYYFILHAVYKNFVGYTGPVVTAEANRRTATADILFV